MNLLIVFPKMSLNLLDFLSETGALGVGGSEAKAQSRIQCGDL